MARRTARPAMDEHPDAETGPATDTTDGEPGRADPDRETDADPTDAPVLRRGAAVEYEPVAAAEGLSKGVLVGPEEGGPAVALRRFTLAPGGSVPRHTNAVEHEQHVLAGEYVVGLGGTEHRVGPGDSLSIPAGTVHWYRNDGATEAAFLCAVPAGDDEIRLVEPAGTDDEAEP